VPPVLNIELKPRSTQINPGSAVAKLVLPSCSGEVGCVISVRNRVRFEKNS